MIAVAFLAAAGGYLLRDSQDLEQEWAHCVDVEAGYDVQYPAEWHVSRGRFACRFFDPEPFVVPEASDFSGTALEVTRLEQSFDDALSSLIDTRFARTDRREQLTLDGRRAFRLELVATGEGLEDRGTRTYGYLLDDEDGPLFLRSTAPPGDKIVHQVVVDRAAASVVTFEPAAASPAPNAALPEAVAETRDAILAAAERGDVDAVAALADPEEFSYTFGGDVEGGPAAFWRGERERGNDPIVALAQILRMPYTLSTGIYVWPFAYDKTADTITDYERELLQPLETTFVGEGYLGWRAGIRPDGRWVFYVAGD